MRPIRRPNTRALRCLAAIACICFCLASQTSDAAITWNLTYEDIDNNTGNGFDDVASGAARRSVFEAALDYVSDVLNENGSVNLTIRQSLTSGTGALASAGSSYFFGGGFQQGLVQQNILNVSPGNTISGSHGSARFDFGYSWNESLAAPATGEFDLFSVSLHEITHAIGFASLTNADGTSPIGPSPATDNTYSNFDQYLRLDDGTELFNASGEFIGDASDLTSNSVVFDGTNAVAANGGSLVEIYSPATFNDGSSMSHIVSANSVMQYSIAPNVLRRTYSDIEIGILQDIGYVNASATAVPEPTSSGLAFVLMIGLFARRQSKRSPRQ